MTQNTGSGPSELLTIGQVAERTGLATSAIRFYEEQGLVSSTRNDSGHRRFRRAAIRRLSFILTAQRLGYKLDEIRTQLDSLPTEKAPTDAQWAAMVMTFSRELDERIAGLNVLREKLQGCIGCGCLSLEKCAIWNAEDHARRARRRTPIPDRPQRVTTHADSNLFLWLESGEWGGREPVGPSDLYSY